MMLKSGKKLLVPDVRNMYLTYGYKPESDVEQACAVIAPGFLPTTGVDINHYHRTTAHTHPRLLRATAEQQGVNLDPKTKLLPCVGCSAAKGLSARLNKTTECRSASERGETESTADEIREGREGPSRQGGGGVEQSDSDDDLEVTWESDTSDAAEGTDDAISDKPVASEGSSPSTVISRPGSFGGGARQRKEQEG